MAIRMKSIDLVFRSHALFVTAFWSMNAMEKFGFLGKDRRVQIAEYLAAFGFGEAEISVLVPLTLTAFAVAESLAAALAIVALILGSKRGVIFLLTSLQVAVVLFAAFVVGDVIVVDRIELVEHFQYGTLFILQQRAWIPDNGGHG